MGAATVVASAIVFALVIIIAYIIVGTSLQTIDVVSSAQSKLTESQEERLRSSIEIISSSTDVLPPVVYIDIQNTGSETLKDFEYWDVYILDSSTGEPVLCEYGTEPLNSNEWIITGISPDTININMFDPEEVLSIKIACQYSPTSWVKVVTPTGVSDSYYVL